MSDRSWIGGSSAPEAGKTRAGDDDEECFYYFKQVV